NRRGIPLGLSFDWPLSDYVDRDVYLIKVRPTLWPNEVDGVRGGIVLSGSQDGVRHRFRFAPTVGALESRVDFLARYTTAAPLLGRSEVEGEVLKAEGRTRIRGLLRMDLAQRLERKPQTHVEAGFQSFEATDPRYFLPN